MIPDTRVYRSIKMHFRQHVFPEFTICAMLIPCSTTAVERSFSLMNDICTNSRNRLSQNSPDAIMRIVKEGLALVWLMVLNTTLNNVSVISWRSALKGGGNRCARKNIDLPQVTDKFYHIMLYTSP